jgi:hypothetical protein
MQDYRVKAEVSKEGSTIAKRIPFQAGDKSRGHHPQPYLSGEKKQRYPLRGKHVRHTDPFGRVAENDWKAA